MRTIENMNISRKKIATRHAAEYSNHFSVLTYNILADYQVVPWRNECYHYADDEDLLKNDGLSSKRHLLTMKELEHFNADVILLQEVEDWYSPLLVTELEKCGYKCTFFQKVGVPDGAVMGYKTDKFECVNTLTFFIHDEVTKIATDEGVPEVVINQLAEPNIALIKTLKDIKTGKVVVCATTHIICDEFAEPALQCLQASLVCRKVHEVRKQAASTLAVSEKDIATVIGGDFNGCPDHMIIQLIKNRKLTPSQMQTLETLTYAIEDRKAKPMEFYEICHVSKYLPKYLENPLELSSAFCDAKGSEPIITYSDGTFTGTLDYIFHSPDLKVTSVVDIDSSVGNSFIHGGPSEAYASDHLPIVAQFAY